MAFSPLDSGLTGPLFTTAAMRDVFEDRAYVAAMLQVEAALAQAEAEHGLAPAGLAEAIRSIDPGSLDIAQLGQGTALAGVAVVPFVKAMQGRLPPALESAFHRGATTQDIADTALVLQLRAALDLIADDLAAVMDGLARLAAAHRDTPCAGRTYGQHAAPVTFGFKAAVWLVGLADLADALPGLRERALVASLGGPVGTLAGLGSAGPAVLEAYAGTLGLAAPPLAWHTRRAGMAEAGAWLARLAGALGKMAGDVAFLCSTEVGEVSEPHVPGRGGSSAMPHKRNPVSSTVILAAAQAALGPASALTAAMVAAQERSAGAWHAEWHAIPTLCGLVAGALAEARCLAEGLVVHPARMQVVLDMTGGLLFADQAAAILAPRCGRAAAHALVEAAAGMVRDRGGTLLDALADRPDLPAGVDRAVLAAAFDPTPAVAAAATFVDRALVSAGRSRSSLS